MTRQADKPCPKCGSMYRNDDVCNRCGVLAPVPVEFYYGSNRGQNKQKFPTEARVWSRQAHKYVGRKYN